MGADLRSEFGKTLSAVQSLAVQLSSMPRPEMLCVYQFKVVLRGISPMIRLVRCATCDMKNYFTNARTPS